MEVLNYEQLVQKIMNHEAGSRNDLSVIESLLETYGNPHLAYPTIHIAGTNGKGQVAGKVYRALSSAGYRVGLFISPHVRDYAERITIDGEKISQQQLTDFYRDLEALCNKLSHKINFFEFTTLFGFRHFQKNQVDIAVIETGLGGRVDSTNVVKPLVSAVTSVSMDHADMLGETIEEIAKEKAGVIKEKTPVVIGPRAKFPTLFETAHALGAPISIVEKQSCFYDTENQAIAKEILSLISEPFPIKETDLKEGMSYCLPCRFEKRGSVIYDVAHNPDAFARLTGALNHLYPYRKFRFLIGMSKNKDLKGCLEQIDRVCEHVHFVKAHPTRGAEPEELAALFEKISTCPYTIETSVCEGAKNAKAALQKGQLLVVCGSFYLMREASR